MKSIVNDLDILVISDLNKEIRVETDISDFAISRVLLIKYKNRSED